MMQLNIDKPIAESLETIGVEESQSVSECIIRIMNALDDLAPLIADDEHITAEVNKDGCKASVLKGESFEKTSAALMSRVRESSEWETIVCRGIIELVCLMFGKSYEEGCLLLDSIKNDVNVSKKADEEC